ncbi:MAG: phospholipase [Desulfobulbus sp.]|nr:MAG: phospholipase [Desulfobulbus sp.]
MAAVFFATLVLILLVTGVYQARKGLPAGLSWQGPEHPVAECKFLCDLTWVDDRLVQHVDQQIMNSVLEMIGEARKLILMDMFLFNDFAGAHLSGLRPLAREVTAALLARKQEVPELRIILITDPINTVYGSMKNPYLVDLEQAGATVVLTDLDQLRDSNVLYSPFWRLFIRPFGEGPGTLLANPFGPGRISCRSYLRLLNFKANHRKVVVTDYPDGFRALVTSANPHDGSSAHGNVALRFSGPAAAELLRCERSVPGVGEDIAANWPIIASSSVSEATLTLQVLSEGKIKGALLKQLRGAGAGDRLNLVIFYLADRQVRGELIRARQRGADLRIVLDPNKDAFGRTKNGIPNRQTAAALVRAGIPIRWGNTHGEQLHSKMLLLEKSDGSAVLLLGSANFTRRNLDDYNLELDVLVRGPLDHQVMVAAHRYVEDLWNNQDGRPYSCPYEKYADHSLFRSVVSCIQEASGMSTF